MAHVCALVVLVVGGFLVLIPLGRRAGERVRRRTAWALATILVLGEVGVHVYHIARDQWSLQKSLPLDMCTLGVFITAYALVTANRLAFEISFFWHWSGGIHGLVTPDIQVGFPEFPFFHTHIEHGVTIIAVLFLMVTTPLRPTWASLWRVFFLSFALLPVVGFLNWAIDANYMFMREKPHGDNLTSVLPDWPWYFLLLIPIALAHYVVIYWVYARFWGRPSASTPE